MREPQLVDGNTHATTLDHSPQKPVSVPALPIICSLNSSLTLSSIPSDAHASDIGLVALGASAAHLGQTVCWGKGVVPSAGIVVVAACCRFDFGGCWEGEAYGCEGDECGERGWEMHLCCDFGWLRRNLSVWGSRGFGLM